MEKIQASLIIEILGRPPEHVKESLATLVTKLGSEKGVKILNKQIHPPVPVKDSKDLFTTFAEIDLELDTLANYFGVLFAYMPSHIEITSPEKLAISNIDLNELANVLVQRLHNYDAIAKQIITERDILLNKLKEVAPYLFKKNTSDKKESAKKKSKKKVKKKIKKTKSKN